MGTIYTNVPGSWYVPGIYVNVDLGRGTPSAALQSRRVMLVGNKLPSLHTTDPTKWQNQFYPTMGKSETTSDKDYKYRYAVPTSTNPAGTDVGKIYSVPSSLMAAARFGYGSELYIMAKAAFDANPTVDLYAYVQAEASGGVQAHLSPDITVDIPGELSAGALTLTILGEKCTVQVRGSEDEAGIAQKIGDVFNGQLRDISYYGNYSGAALNFTAKQVGEIWNGTDLSIDVGGTGITLSGGGGIHPPGTTKYKYEIGSGGGAGSGVPGLGAGAFASATSPLFKERYHYIVIPTTDTTNLGSLTNFVIAQADPIVGFRQQGLFGANGDIATAIGIYADACTNPRVQCAWTYSDEYYPGQIAAAVASVRQMWEGGDVAVNLCLKEVIGVPMTDDANLLTITQKNNALLEGITPLIPHQGRMVILRSVTCAANATAGQVIDTGKVTVSDFIADDIEIKMASRYKGFKLSPDTDIPLPSRVTTPSGIKRSLLEWLRMSEKAGRITRVTELAPAIKVEIDTEVSGRVNFEIPEDVVDIFAVGAGNIIQIG